MTSESEPAENGRAHRDMNSGSDDISDVKLLDGGYGWVVVGASFFNMFCLDGLIGIYGLLYPEFLLHFGAEPAITALPGSIMVGMSCLVGPVCSKLIRRFGFRRVTMLGACVTSVGLLCSYATHSIAVFFVTHGIITGTGCSLFYLPSVTLVNTYFDRKRGVAQGIITAGSGLGVIVLPPVTKFLIGYYGWRATILLWAGFVLNICVSGLLMRPPPPTQGDNNRHGKPINLETKPHNHSLSSSKQGNEQLQSFSYLHENDWIQTEGVRNQFIYFKNRDHSSTRSLPQCYIDKNENSSDHLGLYRSLQCVHHPKPKQYKQVSMYAQNMLDRKDIFLTGSTNILKSNTSNKYIQSKRVEEMEGTDHICAEIESCMTSENDVSHGLCRGSCKPFTKDPAFLLLVAGSALAQMAQHIPMTFMAEYSELIGLDGQDIATLFILFGVVSIAGRLVCGLLASIQMFGPLFVCNFGTVACAVACFLFWLCTTFETLVVFISVYGFFVGFPFPTQPLITVEYVGLDNLTLAFGLIIMAKGPAAMAGPPMAGSLYQLTQSYIYSVIFAGGPLLLSAAVMSLMPFVGKRRYNTKEGPDTVVTSSSSCCNGRQI